MFTTWPGDVQLDLVGGDSLAFGVGQLPVVDRQGVVAPGVEVAELVDAVEDVADKLAQENPRGDAHFAPQPTGHGRGQRGEVGVVDDGPDPARVGGSARVEVPHPGADLDESIEVEPG